MKRPVTERAPRRPVVPRRIGTRPAATDGSGLPHVDLVTGALSEVLQYVARPVSNTLADLHVYAGRPLAARSLASVVGLSDVIYSNQSDPS